MDKIQELESILGYQFKNKKLLITALTHSSYANEHNTECNERMEFLGDAVLELCMSHHLYNNDPNDEGILTKTRAKAVCEKALNVYASKFDFKKFLILGHGEETSGGRDRPAIIADALEAVLGAIYLDGGINPAKAMVNKFMVPYLAESTFKDYKTQLQEKLQSEKRSIRYEIVRDEGPSNNKTFEAVVYMDEFLMGRGIGKSKKEAEQEAARDALLKEAK